MLAPYCAPCVRISQVVALAIKAKHRVCWGPLQTREDTCKYEPAYIPPRSLGAQPSADEHAPSARNPYGPFQFPTGLTVSTGGKGSDSDAGQLVETDEATTGDSSSLAAGCRI